MPHAPSVKIGLVPNLITNDVGTQDRICLFRNLQPRIARLVKGDTWPHGTVRSHPPTTEAMELCHIPRNHFAFVRLDTSCSRWSRSGVNKNSVASSCKPLSRTAHTNARQTTHRLRPRGRDHRALRRHRVVGQAVHERRVLLRVAADTDAHAARAVRDRREEVQERHLYERPVRARARHARPVSSETRVRADWRLTN